MNEDERSERSDRLKKRLSKNQKEGRDESKENKEGTVKDRPSVLMYLPEDLYQELDIRFDELNLEYKKDTGESLQKNKDFYPAVIKAGLEGKDVKDILDI